MENAARRMIQTRAFLPHERQAILSRFVEVPHPSDTPMFCVDGRKGGRADYTGSALNGAYLQGLGGSYNLVALNWLINEGGRTDYVQSADNTFSSLARKKMRISVHRGHHGGGEKSDCGFADNFGKIVKTLQENEPVIWELITQAEGSLTPMISQWKALMTSIKGARLDTIPSGDALITIATEKYNADLQTLDGEHGEVAAVVNLKRNTTLDVDNNQETPAFNLDLWHVVDQAKGLGINEQKATLLSLGLYVATEMVLVEDKNKPRLPIVVNK